jgi:hypothetical protein
MNFKNYKTFIILFLPAIMFLSACKTYEYFNIEVLEPAELFLSPDIQTLAVAHNISMADADSAGTKFNVYDMLGYDTVFIDTSLALSSIKSLAEGLEIGGRLLAVIIDSLPQPYPKSVLNYKTGDVNSLRKLCDDHSANAFLLLNTLEQENAYDVFLDRSGHYFGEFEVIMKTEWLLINPYTSKLIDIKNLSDTVYFQVDPLDLDETNTGFEARKEALTQAAIVAGYEYAAWISPHLVKTSRLIFKKGDKNIKAGYEQAGLGNWKNAAFYWKNALASKEIKIKARACFNLALASEMEGLLEPALEWAKESYQFFPDTLNAIYISILEKRIQQQHDLLRQMDGVDMGN